MFFRSVSPTNVTPGNDTPTLLTDYKSNIDIDVHKPMNSLDTDYRPNYDGRILNILNIIIFIFYIHLCFRFITSEGK